MKAKFVFLLVITGLAVCAQQYTNVSFQHYDKLVYGVLSKPEGAGPFPTIIIAPGSGPTDRDGTIQLAGANAMCLYPNLVNKTLKPYKQLGDELTKAGYAVLRYNKIEYTYSGNIGQISFPKLWLPVESAIDYLKTRSDVDTNNIVLIGHSESSSLIPHIAKSRSDIKAIVSLAGSRMPFDSLLAFQMVDFTMKCGGNVIQAQANAQVVLNYYDTIRNSIWTPSTTAMFGVPPAVWHDYFLAVDPVIANYNQCALKTLFVGFGFDINVPPSQLQRFKDEITIASDFWLIPGLNHYLTTNNDPNLAQVVPDTIIYWLRQNGITSNITTNITRANYDLSQLDVFPVPAGSELTIRFDRKLSEAPYTITTITGETVRAGYLKHSGEHLFIEDLQPGIYFFLVKEGDTVINRRFIRN